MFMPNSAPQSHLSIHTNEYIEMFTAYLISISDDRLSLQTLTRIAKIVRLDLISDENKEVIVNSLSMLADDLNSSYKKRSDILSHFLDLEKRLKESSPKVQLVCLITILEKELNVCASLFQEIYSRLKTNSFTNIQALGMSRDLSSITDPNEIEKIVATWI